MQQHFFQHSSSFTLLLKQKILILYFMFVENDCNNHQQLLVSGFCVENGWNVEDDNSTVHRDELQHGQHRISVYTNYTVQMVELHVVPHEAALSQITSKDVTSFTRQQWLERDHVTV